MKKILLLAILILLCNSAFATVYVKRYPTDTAVSVCTPSDSNTNCGSGGGGGGSGTVTASAIFQVPYYTASTTIVGATNFYNNGTNIGIGTTTGNALLNIASTNAGDLFRVDDNGFGDTTPGFLVSATGNVGIGTTDAKVPFQVESTGVPYALTVVNNAAGITNVGIGTVNTSFRGLLGEKTGGNNSWDLYWNNRNTGTTANTRLQLTSSGSNSNLNFNISSSGQTALGGFPSGTSAMSYSDGGTATPFIINSSSGLILATNSIGRATLDTAGNLGIGTINVGDQFIYPRGATAGNVLVSSSIGLGTWMSPTSIGASGGPSTPNGGQNAVMYVNPVGTQAGTENIFSFNGTNVGVGTSNGKELLHVSGNVGIGTQYVNIGSMIGVVGNSSTPLITLMKSTDFVSSPAAFVVLANGRVGIGTSAPASPVEITTGNVSATNGSFVAGVGFTGNGGDLTLTSSAAKAIVGSGGFCVNGDTSHGCIKPTSSITSDLLFQLNSVTNMIMDTNGNIGIGTITPTAKLNVSTALSQDLFRVDDNGIPDTTPFIIDSTGNVGIGSANPSAALAISSTAAQTLFRVDDNGTGDLSPFIVDQNGNVGIGTTNTETDKLLIMGGNVGIGTWIPSTALDVKGTIVQTGLQLTGNGAAAGNVLVSSTVGVGTWMAASTLPITGGSGSPGGSSPQLQYNNAGSFGGITSGGTNGTNIGIGTVDFSRVLNVNGNIGIGTLANSGYFSVPFSSGTAMALDGNIGIGTWSTTARLTIFGTNSSSALLNASSGIGVLNLNGNGQSTIANTNTGSASGIKMTGGGNAASALVLQSTSGVGTSDRIIFNVGNNGGTTAMTVITNGNIGLGTTAPSTRLAVVGGIGIGTINAGDSYTSIAAPNGGMIVESNVGIGSFNPGTALDINGTARLSGSGDSYLQGNLGIGTVIPMGMLAVQGSIVQGTVAYTGRAVDTNTVALSGNVGIGTWNPTQQLVITGNVGIGTTLSNTLIGGFSPASPGGQLYVQGNVGIGSNAPQSGLTLGGNAHLGSTGTAPTVASNDCGSTGQGTIVAGSTDLRGQVTVGTLTVTSCAVTFNVPFGRAPICLTQDDTNILGVKNTQTTTKLTITSTTSMSSDVVAWVCVE